MDGNRGRSDSEGGWKWRMGVGKNDNIRGVNGFFVFEWNVIVI